MSVDIQSVRILIEQLSLTRDQQVEISCMTYNIDSFNECYSYLSDSAYARWKEDMEKLKIKLEAYVQNLLSMKNDD